MPDQRIQIDRPETDPRLPRPEAIQPVASPVDTFTRPQAGAQLSQLADALSGLAPGLQRFSDAAYQKESQDNATAADAAFEKAKERNMTYAAAVKAGVIQPNQSRVFQERYQARAGRVTAGDYSADLTAAVQADPDLQNSTDPASFSKFEQQFRQQWVDKNVPADQKDNPHFLQSFGVMAEAAVQDAQLAYAKQAGARMEIRAGDDLTREAGQILSKGRDSHEAPAVVLAQMQAIKDDYLSTNPKGGRVATNALLQAIQDYALAPDTAGQNDPLKTVKDVESIMRGITTVPGSTLYDAKDAQAMLADVQGKLFTAQDAQARSETAVAAGQKRQKELEFWTDVTTVLEKDPHADLTQFYARLKDVDPTPQGIKDLQELQKSLSNPNPSGDDSLYKQAVLWTEGVDSAHPGQLLTTQQVARLSKNLTAEQTKNLLAAVIDRDKRAAEGAANGGSKLLDNKLYANGVDYLLHNIVGDEYSQDVRGEDESRFEAAKQDFTVDFLQKWPTLEHLQPSDQAKQIQALAEKYFKANVDPEKDVQQHHAPGAAPAQPDPIESAVRSVTPQDGPALRQIRDALKRKVAPTPEGIALLRRLHLAPKDAGAFVSAWDQSHPNK